MFNMFATDAPQQALAFLQQQLSYIEPVVYATRYADIQYPNLIPVDTSANEWTKSITFYSSDQVGRAEFFHHTADDMPYADVTRQKFEQGIEMAAIGYTYTMEELAQAMMLPGRNIGTERADAARRAYEEFVDDTAFRGQTIKGWTGLLNNADVSVITVAHDGAGGGGTSAEWDDKTGDQIIRDVNDALSAVFTTSLQIEMADTVLLPVTMFTKLGTLPRGPNTDLSILEWLSKYNVYTAQTGQSLTFRAVRGLETAGAGGLGRMIVYRRDPSVLKMHIPMPHRFLPAQLIGVMKYAVPGIFRLGPVEIRRPASVRYVDGIMDSNAS
jgi:hypothetical protein